MAWLDVNTKRKPTNKETYNDKCINNKLYTPNE